MGHDQPDESDRADERDHARGEERRAQEDGELEPIGGDAELEQRLLSEGHQIQLARVRHDEPEAEGR